MGGLRSRLMPSLLSLVLSEQNMHWLCCYYYKTGELSEVHVDK